MKMSLTLVFASFIFLASGCATKPVQPDWVAGDNAKYKSNQYLIGRGQAPTLEEAKDRARADLAKIFQIAVTIDSDDVQRFKSDPKSPDSVGQYSGETSRRISTRSEQIVSGIQIVELWQDPASKNHHALAVLPRLQAATRLRQQIDQLDDATQASIEQSRMSTDILIKIAAASQAIEFQQERTGLQKSLQVVDIAGRGVEPKYNVAKLNSDMDDLIKRVKIAPTVLEGSTPGLIDIIAGALSHAGFMIDTGNNPDFLLTASMKLTDLGLKEGWYWQRGNLEISLTEATTDRVRGTQRWEIKGTATDKDNALRRALNEANAVLKKELRSAIINMATNSQGIPD